MEYNPEILVSKHSQSFIKNWKKIKKGLQVEEILIDTELTQKYKKENETIISNSNIINKKEKEKEK